MTKDELLQKIRGQVIISCQALPGEPLYDEQRSLMPYMAAAAKQAGTPLIRTNSVRDVVGIRKATGLPVIGLIKMHYDGYENYITPTMKEVDQLVEAGAEIIAVDATFQKRGDGRTPGEYLREIRTRYPEQMLLADISTYEEGLNAEANGADLISTTLSGYTSYSPKLEGPDFELVGRLAKAAQIPVLAEGRIHTPEDAVRMLQLGAYAVIIGEAITRPLEIASRFVRAVEGIRQ